MNKEQIKNVVLQKIEGATFEQLVEITEGLEDAGVYDLEIHDPIIDKMIKLDEDKFFEWEEKYNSK